MQDCDELAPSIEDGCDRVAFARKFTMLLAEIEGCDLPEIVLELITLSHMRMEFHYLDCIAQYS